MQRVFPVIVDRSTGRIMSRRPDIRRTFRSSLKGKRSRIASAMRRRMGTGSFRGFGRRPAVERGFTRTAGFFGRFGSGGELKFHDVDLDDGLVSTAGTVVDSIIKIAQGTTESTRIGRKCTIRNIGWRFNILMQEDNDIADPTAADVIRVIMYLDKQCNGATATVTGILESADYQSFNNLGNKSRFRTLLDRTYDVNKQSLASATTGTVASNEIVISDTFFKKVNIPIEYDSTAGAITEIRSNNIGVLLIGRAGVAGFVSKIRIRFSDN